MKLNMSRDEREAFLAGTHVGVFAVAEAGRGPCAVPVWYRYAPGGPVHITMGPDSRKVRLLREAGRASLCAQQEALPSKYVSVEGPVEVVQGDVAAAQREIALRYLGPKLGARYLESLADMLTHEVLVVLRPERWWSIDFSRMSLG
jgi:nitroimidazol reductase NimA-like FMN-containing flavoprotein (pyridoxamine 5'-phosphate oxidase superfamily)